MKDKFNIRYIGFKSGKDGARLFDFSASAKQSTDSLISIEIPGSSFSGESRIRLQEGVAICYAKLKHLLDLTALDELPARLSLTPFDIAEHREVISPSTKRRSISNPLAVSDGTADVPARKF